MHYDKQDLINKYRFVLPERIAEDYLVRTISIIDAVLEDIYELLLRTFNSGG